MKLTSTIYFLLFCMVSTIVFAQPSREKIDTTAISKIKDEGMNHSQVMEILSYLSDVYGPRLTGSPDYQKAAEWTKTKLASWNLDNPHFEQWGTFGKGWTLKRYYANVIEPKTFPLISYPKAWSPETDGKITGEVIYLDAKTDSALDTYKGKLKKKFVLFSDVREIKAHWDPEASREQDSSLLKMANADLPQQRRGGQGQMFQQSPEEKARAVLQYKKWMMCQEEGALAVLEISRGDGGNMFVQGATVFERPIETILDLPFNVSEYGIDKKDIHIYGNNIEWDQKQSTDQLDRETWCLLPNGNQIKLKVGNDVPFYTIKWLLNPVMPLIHEKQEGYYLEIFEPHDYDQKNIQLYNFDNLSEEIEDSFPFLETGWNKLSEQYIDDLSFKCGVFNFDLII